MCSVPGLSKSSRDRLLPLPAAGSLKVRELSQRTDSLKRLLSECQEESDFWFEKWLDAQKSHKQAQWSQWSQRKYSSPWAAAATEHRVRTQTV